jgi:hypothetical protein
VTDHRYEEAKREIKAMAEKLQGTGDPHEGIAIVSAAIVAMMESIDLVNERLARIEKVVNPRG